MRAVITVVGKDTVGILAKVSSICAAHNVNVTDVTQSILQDLFVMVMLVDIRQINTDFSALADELDRLGGEMGLSIKMMHEDIFNSMHRI